MLMYSTGIKLFMPSSNYGLCCLSVVTAPKDPTNQLWCEYDRSPTSNQQVYNHIQFTKIFRGNTSLQRRNQFDRDEQLFNHEARIFNVAFDWVGLMPLNVCHC